MNVEFLPYEESLTLKKLGFVEDCFGYYNYEPISDGRSRRGLIIDGYQDHNEENEDDDLICSAILWQQATRWFKGSYKIECRIHGEDQLENIRELIKLVKNE